MRWTIPLILITATAAWVQQSGQLTIADFEGEFDQCRGVSRDTDIVHSGRASARWSDHPQNRIVVLDDIPADWTRFENLEFWLHSQVNNDAGLRLVILSQNPDTEGPDYWWKKIRVDWTGWRYFSIPRESLGDGARQPRGWDHIDRLTFRPAWGCEPKSDTVIHIDDVRLSSDTFRAAIINTGGRRSDGAIETRHTISVTNRIDDTITVRARIRSPEGVRVTPQSCKLMVGPSAGETVAVEVRCITDVLMDVSDIAFREVNVSLTGDGAGVGTRIELRIPLIEVVFTALEQMQRPRLLVNDDIVERLRQRAENDERSRKIAEDIISYADRVIQVYADGIPEKQLANVKDGVKLQLRSRALAMAFLLTQDEKYAREAARVIAAAKNWSRWVLKGRIGTMKADLKTAGALRHFAIAYDWAYPGMTPEERRNCREAINIGLDLWKQAIRGRVFWSRSFDTNWCAVCCGGGGIAAIALLGERDDAPELIAEAYWRVVRFLNEGGIDGGWPEGVSYWGLGVSFAGLFAEAVKVATGADIDLFKHPFFEATWQFPLYMHCPHSGAINFADCYYRLPHELLTLQLGRQTNNPYAVWYYRNYPQESALDLLWNNPELASKRPDDVPESIHFRGIDWAALRAGWSDDATILGIRGGNNGEHHGMLECGNFVINSRGERLIVDHGKPKYARGYFGPKRWEFYRANSHGSNVVLVDDKDQLSGKDAAGQIHDFFTSGHIDYLRLDATAAYPDFVSGIERRILFIKPDIFVMFDNVVADGERSYEWRCHPTAKGSVQLGADRMAVENGGAALTVRWLLPDRINIIEAGEDAAARDKGGIDYHVEVIPKGRSKSMQFLTAFRCADAETAGIADAAFPLGDEAVASVDVAGGVGCRFSDVFGGTIVAFATGNRGIETSGVRADAAAIVSGGAATKNVSDDLLAAINATRIAIGGKTVMTSDAPVSFALRPEPDGRREMGVVDARQRSTVKLRLGNEYTLQLDGSEADMSSAEDNLRTLKLPAGRHEIVLVR